MVMWYWSVAILFWQLSIDHIVNVQYKRCGFAKTRLRHPSLPFDSLPYPTLTICRRVRTLGQSRDNQTKRGRPYSMSMGLPHARSARGSTAIIYWALLAFKSIRFFRLWSAVRRLITYHFQFNVCLNLSSFSFQQFLCIKYTTRLKKFVK